MAAGYEKFSTVAKKAVHRLSMSIVVDKNLISSRNEFKK